MALSSVESTWIIFILCFVAKVCQQSTEKPKLPVFVQEPQNLTALVKAGKIINCRFSGDKISIEWEKDGKNLQSPGSTYRILKSGSLRFFKISIGDKGTYRCKGKNKHGEIYSKYIHVDVHTGVVFLRDAGKPSVHWIQKKYDSPLILECNAVGIPDPHIYWYHNGTEIVAARDKKELTVTVKNDSKFICNATNYPLGKKTSISKTTIVQVINKPPGQCVTYQGSLCQNYLKNASIYVPMTSSLDTLEKKLQQMHSNIDTLDKKCLRSINKLLCHYQFPECLNATSPTVVPKPLCRENCEIMKSFVCTSSWSHVELSFSQCSDLPSLHNTSTSCLNLHLESLFVTTDCYNDNGSLYNGTINVTTTGRQCVSWDVLGNYQRQQYGTYRTAMSPMKNYCRNPNNREKKPWCYTNLGHLEWELCDVPKCQKPEAVVQAREMYHPDKGNETIPIATAVPCAVVFMLGMVVMFVYIRRRCSNRLHKMKYIATPQDLSEELSIDVLSKLHTNECFNRMKEIKEYEKHWEKLEYPRNNIIHIKDLGCGAFGPIFLAECPNLNGANQQVAVRVLSSETTEDVQEEFEEEMVLLSQLSHQNILPLVAVCTIGKPMCALVEYMSDGDLDAYLRAHSNIIPRAEEFEMCINIFEQLKISKQVALAMDYFTGRGFVHRDLAARNCLVGQNLIVKLSDFGLARSTAGIGYYKGDDEEPIAIRWMSPEVILYNTFSVDSDIYSYGVFLWEVFGCGSQPYAGLSTDNVLLSIKDGRLLDAFTNTPQIVYDLMCKCWSTTPAGRPRFNEIHKSLSKIKMSLEH